MRIYILILLALFSTNVFSQVEPPDTMINKGLYKSFYSRKQGSPSFVVYKLYKGGGKGKRSGTFRKDVKKPFNYKGTGYHRGHLVAAEDFAYNKKLLDKTFYYSNVLPQKPKLNLGKWKSYETKIRKLSQKDSLLIICGGYSWEKGIPEKCFKVVYSLTDGTCYYALMFDNGGNYEVSSGYHLDRAFPYRRFKHQVSLYK